MKAVAPPTQKGNVALLRLRVEAERLAEIGFRQGRQAEGEGQETQDQETGLKAQQARDDAVEDLGKLHAQVTRQTGKTNSVGDAQRGHGHAQENHGKAVVGGGGGRHVGDDHRRKEDRHVGGQQQMEEQDPGGVEADLHGDPREHPAHGYRQPENHGTYPTTLLISSKLVIPAITLRRASLFMLERPFLSPSLLSFSAMAPFWAISARNSSVINSRSQIAIRP